MVTAGEKVEQRLTRRPSSTHQGGRWPQLLDLSPGEDILGRNLAMHYAHGWAAGA